MKKLISMVILSLCFVTSAKADDWRDNFGYGSPFAKKPSASNQRYVSKKNNRQNKPEKENRFVKNIPVVRDIVQGVETGIASFYWQPQAVACGGRFNPSAMTAAHKTLPCGSQVRVTNVTNGRTAVVTINDRGPFIKGRIIDLSKAAAELIGMTKAGVVPVKVERFK